MDNFEKIVIEQKKQNFLVAGLFSRYGLKKSAVYEKLRVLSIIPFREGRKSYISPEDLQLLDDLVKYLEEGKGETKDFIRECVESGRIVQKQQSIQIEPECELESPSETEAIVLCEPQESRVIQAAPKTEYLAGDSQGYEISSESAEYVNLTELYSSKQQKIDAQDLQEINRRAQERAFNKAVAEESMTLIYESTENFTILGMKEQLEAHRQACASARVGKGAGSQANDFLSQAIATATGLNG